MKLQLVYLINLFSDDAELRDPVSKLCDVYSYGIFLWELLTHQQPFSDVFPTSMVMNEVVAGEVQ